jgi:hypothetical protein
VGPTAGLDDVDKRKFLTLQGLELRPLGHPARRQSLCELRYPGSYLINLYEMKILFYLFLNKENNEDRKNETNKRTEKQKIAKERKKPWA